MAKVQGKKKGATKKASVKPKLRAKSAKPAPKRPAKAAAKRPMKASKSKPKASNKQKKVARKIVKPATKLKVSKKGAAPAKATKPTAKPAAPAARAAAPVSKASKAKAVAVKTVKAVVKVAGAAVAAAAAATVAVKRVAPAIDEKKRARRSRPKVQSGGVATATWFSQGARPRPSSFIPAPPRAEAPSLVAAPPASSDRLVSSDELTEFAVRTVPVRVDVEANSGRIYLNILPMDVTLRPGEGIEWDFRYIGGADVIIDELMIEFEKPSPFSHLSFKSRRPGSNRPHRQLSGAVSKNAVGKQIHYIVRAFNAVKMEMATAKPDVTVVA